MASCANTTNFGGFIALQNLLTNGGALPSVVSISYGSSETSWGAAGNSYINTLYQLAAAEGVSVFVSSGDSAAAGSDRGSQMAIHGINVSAFASTIYNVSVGGTDFGDTASGTASTFWNSANGPYYASAKSYIREIPWNESCAGQVLANYYGYCCSLRSIGSLQQLQLMARYCHRRQRRAQRVRNRLSQCRRSRQRDMRRICETILAIDFRQPERWRSRSAGCRAVRRRRVFGAHYYVFCLHRNGGSCRVRLPPGPGPAGPRLVLPSWPGFKR